MNAKQLFDLVSDMRIAQKSYFRTRSRIDLQDSKRLEKQVDEEIRRVNDRLSSQLDLFNT